MKTAFTLILGHIREPQHKNKSITLEELLSIIQGTPSNEYIEMQEARDNYVELYPERYPKDLFTSEYYMKLKNSQKAFILGGWVPKGHGKKDLISNGYIQLDIDIKHPNGMKLSKKLLNAFNGNCVFCVVSGSGFGIKCLVRTDITDMLEHETKHLTQALEAVSNQVINKALTPDEALLCVVDSLQIAQPCFIPYAQDMVFNTDSIWPISNMVNDFKKREDQDIRKRRKKAQKMSSRSIVAQDLDTYGLNLAFNAYKNHGSGFEGTHQAHLRYSALCMSLGIDMDTAWSYLIGRTQVGCTFRHFEKMYTDNFLKKSYGTGRIELETLFLEEKQRRREYMKEKERSQSGSAKRQKMFFQIPKVQDVSFFPSLIQEAETLEELENLNLSKEIKAEHLEELRKRCKELSVPDEDLTQFLEA